MHFCRPTASPSGLPPATAVAAASDSPSNPHGAAAYGRTDSRTAASPSRSRAAAIAAAAPAPAPDVLAAAGCFGSAQSPDTPCAPRLPVARGHGERRLVGGPGSVFSPGYLLQYLDVQRLVGDHPLESAALILESTQLFGVVRLHASVLIAPAPEGVLADSQLLGHLGDLLAFAEQPIRFLQLAHDLLRRVLPAFHSSSSLPSRAVVEPSYHVDLFSGVRSTGLYSPQVQLQPRRQLNLAGSRALSSSVRVMAAD